MAETGGPVEPARTGAAAADTTAGGAERPTLRGLLDVLREWPAERDAFAAGADTGLPRADEWPGLPALQELHLLWAGLRSRGNLRRALAAAPADAGPLNSRALVHRMLQLMQEQSPGYLRHFTAYVDMLAELDGLRIRATPETAAVPAKSRKRTAARPRGS